MGVISASVASTNFLQSILEKEHQVSPQGKRAGGTQQWSGYIQRDSNYQFPIGSCFYPKNPGSTLESGT